MFTIETIKVTDPKKYKKTYANMRADMAAALHLVESQGNYKKIGSGSYGTVYGSKDSDIVYKIGGISYNYGYLAYVRELAKLKTHNPFLPRIYGCRTYIHESHGCFVVAMERLQEGKGSKFHDIVDDLSCIIDYGHDISEYSFDKKWNIDAKQLKAASKLINRAYKKSQFEDCTAMDLHSGNFMIRNKNQIVITDPIA